jgi:dihydrofolate reductase
VARRLRYGVAVSLDGFIARANGAYDWIVMDPAIDFAAMAREFDTAVMGRKTWEAIRGLGDDSGLAGIETIVFSRTLSSEERPGLRITNDDPVTTVDSLKQRSGRDIWLYGGGELFRTLLAVGLVDTVEVAIIPVLLGQGIPILPPGTETKLVLSDQKVLPESGIVALAYAVPGGSGPAPRIRYVRPGTA